MVRKLYVVVWCVVVMALGLATPAVADEACIEVAEDGPQVDQATCEEIVAEEIEKAKEHARPVWFALRCVSYLDACMGWVADCLGPDGCELPLRDP